MNDDYDVSWSPWMMTMMWVGAQEWWLWCELEPMNEDYDVSWSPWMMTMMWVGAREWWLWCELEPVNDNYDPEMLNENTSNLQSQKNLIY